MKKRIKYKIGASEFNKRFSQLSHNIWIFGVIATGGLFAMEFVLFGWIGGIVCSLIALFAMFIPAYIERMKYQSEWSIFLDDDGIQINNKKYLWTEFSKVMPEDDFLESTHVNYYGS